MSPSNNSECHNNLCFHCGVSILTLASSVLPPALIIVLLLGLPSNLLALYVFCRNLQSWRPTVVFLFNLVLADLMLLLNVPFRIYYHLHNQNWVFGDAFCRINLFMLAANRTASISFMSALAVDRYLKIVHPHHKVNDVGVIGAAGIACVIWAVVFLLRIPLLSNNLLNLVNGTLVCRSFYSFETMPPGMHLHNMVYISEFFFSLVLLVFCSLRIYCVFRLRQLNKKKNVRQAIRMVLVIIAVFLICFCPGVATGLIALYVKRLGAKYCKTFYILSESFLISIGATYLNSVLDPVIYCFSSSMFRDALKDSVKWFEMDKLLQKRRSAPTPTNLG